MLVPWIHWPALKSPRVTSWDSCCSNQYSNQRMRLIKDLCWWARLEVLPKPSADRITLSGIHGQSHDLVDSSWRRDDETERHTAVTWVTVDSNDQHTWLASAQLKGKACALTTQVIRPLSLNETIVCHEHFHLSVLTAWYFPEPFAPSYIKNVDTLDTKFLVFLSSWFVAIRCK